MLPDSSAEETYEEQECAEQQEEQDRTCQVRIVHDVLVYPRQRVQHRERLPLRMPSANLSFTTTMIILSQSSPIPP